MMLAVLRLLLLLLPAAVARTRAGESSSAAAAGAPPAQLNGHPLKLSADGEIETWLPNATAHHDFIARAMGHWRRLP